MKYFSSSVLLTFSLAIKRRVRGVAAVLLLFLVGAVAVLAAFNSDSTRMTGDAAQLKRATDAAALAATMAYARDSKTNVQEMAERYIRANLGLDDEQLQQQLVVSTEKIKTDDDRQGWRVRASFVANSMIRGANSQEVSVQSAAVAMNKAIEVALAIPNTLTENEPNLVVLRRLGNRFAQRLIEGRKNAWLALVPYSQAVNVSPEVGLGGQGGSRGPGAKHSARLQNWAAAGALYPVELTSLWRSGYAGHGDRRMPDRRANLLCLYRGMATGQNYFWDRAPGSTFRVYYRADLPINGSPGAPAVQWTGPNPMFGQATGDNDTRFIVADKGCPHAPLLPLTNDLDAIRERLRIMNTRFNVNHAIAMGWAAMALAPDFRGLSGWGDSELPLDFDTEDGHTTKAIILMVNSSNMPWFDSDWYNFPTNAPGVRHCAQQADHPCFTAEISQRFANLCRSFKEKKIRFFLLVAGNDEATDTNDDGTTTQVTSASDFRRIAGAGLQACAEEASDLTYIKAWDFVAAENKMQDRMDEIIETLRQQSNYAYLIE